MNGPPVPLVQARPDQALENFNKDAEQAAQASVERCQAQLEETIDSMLRLLRNKRSNHSS